MVTQLIAKIADYDRLSDSLGSGVNEYDYSISSDFSSYEENGIIKVKQSQLWLTVIIDESHPQWPPRLDDLRIALKMANTLQEYDYPSSFRTSPIFPLRQDFVKPDLSSCYFYFYFFDPAFPVLGRLLNIGSDKLTKRLWYTIGLASILLITEDPELNKELLGLAPFPPRDVEFWTVKDSNIAQVSCEFTGEKQYHPEKLKVCSYEGLPVTARAIVDEFVATISLIVPKVAMHMPSELETFLRLVGQINELIEEVVYLVNPKGAPPATLDEYSEERLQADKSLGERIMYQDLDRLIQVNSALSYVSTQALSGAVPILERRSLIRRYSLLGIGTAILALNRIARSIELAFSQFPIEDIIADRMADATPLPGLESLPAYDPSNWLQNHSVNRWADKVKPRIWYPKLPHYSGRLGFRETEYTISAAIQVLTGGASLEWSLLTVTHEMLHGHVRNLLTLLFQGDIKQMPEDKSKLFYERYRAHLLNESLTDHNELDSLRSIVLAYCCLTITHGSLTRKPLPENQIVTTRDSSEIVREISRGFYLPSQEKIWKIFEAEYRNISEIFVHVLDLHYFYGSRLSAYIPLIWRSWAAVPHVRGDLRQYILRSLLIISVTASGSPYERFNTCAERLNELLRKHIEGILDIPLIKELRSYLADTKLREALFYPFSASLILVDTVNNLFVSRVIRGKLLGDPLVHWVSDEADFEETYEYRLPEGFSEEIVQRPAAYLLDRVLRQLQQSELPGNLEAETAKLILACCSNSDLEV